MRVAIWMGLGLLMACWVGAPAHGQPPEPDVIVGRADADASGGWPVMLWVRDGANSRVVVRAPRRHLGAGPWHSADAQALLHLERFAAPRLLRRLDDNPCPTALDRGRVIHLPSDHWGGEQQALAHPACAAGRCVDEAWQMKLSAPVDDDALPLAQLLPGLGRDRTEWLVLLVASPAQALTLEGVPQLRVPESLRYDRPMERWLRDVFPAEAAASFPAMHTAMLERMAAAQGLASASVLMRSEAVGYVERAKYVRSWNPSSEQRQALGLAGKPVQGHNILRLLLRLNPGSTPTRLSVQAVDWQSSELMDQLYALEPQPVDLSACRQKLAAMSCKASCEAGTAPCVKRCERQRETLDASIQGRFEAAAQRQRDAWRWVEALTGRSDWRSH